MGKVKQGLLKYILIICLIICAVILVNRFNIFKDFSPKEIKDEIKSFGIWAPVIYLILLTLLPLLLFPDSILVISGGMVFGLCKGTLLTLLGSLGGATLAFWLSRGLGQKIIKKFIKKDLVIFKEQSKRNGFIIILLLRLIPLFPFKVVSYSAGFSDIKYKDFLFATMFGSLPGIIIYTNVGDKFTAFGSTKFYKSVALFIILFIVSIWLKKKFSIKGIGGETSEKNL